MTTTHHRTRRHPEIREALDQILTLRDDVKLKLHLGAMDIRDEWKQLEPRVADAERDVERLVEEAGAASTAAVSSALDDLALELHRIARKIGHPKGA